MKKYLFLAASAALILAACAKIETDENLYVVDENVPIGFSSYSPRSLTKAGATYTETAALPSASKIGVYGYSPAAADNAHFLGTESPAFIANGEVAFSAASNVPKGTTVTRYWPKDLKNLLTFYGYYPFDNAVITSKPTASTAGLGSFAVTQTGDVTTMVDFMISDVQNDMYYWDGTNASSNTYGRKSTIDTESSTYGIVPLTLHHMMSNVNFYFKTNITTEGVKIQVKSASIAGVLSQGTFTPDYTVPTTAGNQGATNFTAAATASTAYASAVTIPIGSVVSEANKDFIELTTTAAINYTNAAAEKTKNNFLFIPQTLTDDVKVTITYDLTQGGATTENTVEVKIKGVANDANNAITAWAYNTKYDYIFTIGLHEILFTGAATDWTDGGDGFITVQ